MAVDSAQVALCLVCLSPPADSVSRRQPLPGSGRPLCDVMTELLTRRETLDRDMLDTVCGRCHRLLADFDQVSEQARGLRATIQSVFDRADRSLVAMLLEPRQSRAVLAAAARHGGTQPAVHIEILQTDCADSQDLAQPPAEAPNVGGMLEPAVGEPDCPSPTAADPVPSLTASGTIPRPALADTVPSLTAPHTVPSLPVMGISPSLTISSTVPSITASGTVPSLTVVGTVLPSLVKPGAAPSLITTMSKTPGDEVPHAVSTTAPARAATPEQARDTGRRVTADPYRCSVCGHAFRDKSLLLAHRRRQHASRASRRPAAAPFTCSVCQQMLPSRAALRRHALSHTASEGHVCATCGRTFKRAATLRAHSMLHDERGLRCPYCPQKYTSRQDLEQHVARHTGARNFACPECGKTYRFRSNLAHHVQTVHRRIELACRLCGKTFNMQKKLNRHCNIMHGRLRFKCSECDSQFCYESQLRRHMKKSKHSSGADSVDQSLEAYIETVETGEDGTQMLTLVIDDGVAGPLGEDDTRQTLVLSVEDNFNHGVTNGPLDGSGIEVDCVRGDSAILEIIEEDDDSNVGHGNQIIFQG